ncbi:MAG: hypothetical protein V4671_15905 [Armatimonadota bacterium]
MPQTYNHDGNALWGSFAAVTPDDDTDLPTAPCNGLWVGSDGDVAVVDRDGNEATFANVPGGSILPVRAVRVLATGTTATGIVAGY